MRISQKQLLLEAESTGFRAEILEKVILLLNLLNLFSQDSLLKDKLVLSGGTALNLFVFDIPRLSIDIDLDYTGKIALEGMKIERPDVEDTIARIVKREGFSVEYKPVHHAGGKWKLQYQSILGGSGTLQVDVNFLLRVLLFPVQYLRPKYLVHPVVESFPVLDIHELAAGKLAALFSRTTSRDVFDSNQLLNSDKLSKEKLKFAFIVYGAFNRENWLEISPDKLKFPERNQFINEILSMLREDYFAEVEDKFEWADNLINDLKDKCRFLVDYSDKELEFLTSVIEHGEIIPSLLTSDSDLMHKIEIHPALQWKALNVRNFKAGL